MNSNVVFLVIAIICLITFVVTRRIFQEQLKIGPPTILAAAVAGLAFIGLSSHGDKLVSVVLLPFATLAIALLLLLLLRWLFTPFKKHPKGRRLYDQYPSPVKPDPKRINSTSFTPKPRRDQSPSPIFPGASADRTTRKPPHWQGRWGPFCF